MPPTKRQRRWVHETAAKWEMTHDPVELGKQCMREHIPINRKGRQEPVPGLPLTTNNHVSEESRDYTGPGTSCHRDHREQCEPVDSPWEPGYLRAESPRVHHMTTKASVVRLHTKIYPHDRLDTHVNKAIRAFHQASCWGDFVRSVRGRRDLHPEVVRLPHPAASLLHSFQ